MIIELVKKIKGKFSFVICGLPIQRGILKEGRASGLRERAE